jgi:DNA-binding CsgD family transcriptional regulator
MGIDAYIHKSASADDLVATLEAEAGRGPGGQNVVVSMPRGLLGRLGEGPMGALSKRKTEVVVLAARGLPNARIAEELHVAEATVKRHLANIYEKVGVHSRTEVVRTAPVEQWIGIGEITRAADGDGSPSGLGPDGTYSPYIAQPATQPTRPDRDDDAHQRSHPERPAESQTDRRDDQADHRADNQAVPGRLRGHATSDQPRGPRREQLGKDGSEPRPRLLGEPRYLVRIRRTLGPSGEAHSVDSDYQEHHAKASTVAVTTRPHFKPDVWAIIARLPPRAGAPRYG